MSPEKNSAGKKSAVPSTDIIRNSSPLPDTANLLLGPVGGILSVNFAHELYNRKKNCCRSLELQLAQISQYKQSSMFHAMKASSQFVAGSSMEGPARREQGVSSLLISSYRHSMIPDFVGFCRKSNFAYATVATVTLVFWAWG